METLHCQIIQKLVDTFYGRRLVNNVDRGHYVESMIALVLGKQWRPTALIRRGWAPWDFESDDGARLEVKQSAALQPWSVYPDAPKTRPPSFDIAFRKEVWTKGGGLLPILWGDQRTFISSLGILSRTIARPTTVAHNSGVS